MPYDGADSRGFRVGYGDATGEQLVLVVPSDYRVVHFAEALDVNTDWNVAAPTHPTWYFHSATTPATDYASVDHDGTDFTLNVAGGNLKLALAGTDILTMTSTALAPASDGVGSLGTTALRWDNLYLATAGVIDFGNGEVVLTEGANVLTLTGGTFDLTYTTLGATDIGMPVFVTVSAPNNQSGMAAYFDVTINGTTAGHNYGVGSWINTGPTSPVLAASHIIVPFEGGVYTGEAQTNARIVFGGQHQAILNGAPASLHAWRLNTTQTITALIAAANAGSIGYTAGVAAGTAVGWVAFCEVVGGPTPGYVKIYSATS